MSYRSVALYGVEKPAWRLDKEPTWRLAKDVPRSAAVFDLVQAPDDPATMFVPSAAPRLEPINGGPVGTGVAIQWNRWGEIRENGQRFLEKFSPGAFAQTLKPENRNGQIVPLLNHGSDPVAGLKPLGRMAVWEAADGLRFGISFLDVGYANDVVKGVAENLYGASIRFAAQEERVRSRPGRSRENPLGLETRNITKARLVEISATPVPAHAGTSVALAA